LKKYTILIHVHHSEILRKFEEVNYVVKTSMEGQPLKKKRRNTSYSSISDFFISKEPFKKDDVEQ
jgi:hypothetical protein